MGIDSFFWDRLSSIGEVRGIFAGRSVAILGDCRFITSWATGDNAIDLEHFRKVLGIARIETLDIGGAPTIRMDLHEPLPRDLQGQFDVVIDAGTVHCCFDVARVLENCLGLLKDGGTIFHLSALTGFMGRAYYCFNPLLFKDFYAANGFTPITCEYRATKTAFPAARRLRRWLRLRGRQADGFHPIPLETPYLQHADYFRMTFGPDSSHFAQMLPNDAVILFAATRTAPRPFTRPIPSFFAAANPVSAPT